MREGGRERERRKQTERDTKCGGECRETREQLPQKSHFIQLTPESLGLPGTKSTRIVGSCI
eukprot:1114632-Rhodomonas_salina.1